MSEVSAFIRENKVQNYINSPKDIDAAHIGNGASGIQNHQV